MEKMYNWHIMYSGVYAWIDLTHIGIVEENSVGFQRKNNTEENQSFLLIQNHVRMMFLSEILG